VRLLLDTHALLWWLADNPILSGAARQAIANQDSAVFVSAASVWEIAIKRSLGRLELSRDITELLGEERFEALAITLHHAEAAGNLPRHHGDPFDRMLVAQARLEGLTLVTRDDRLAPYGTPILRA
jgi:PIN domain nuclease of toxin-antitoxin system